MKDTFLSVIIPVYNNEKEVKTLIDEVLNLKIYDRLEIICVDDGSEDRSFDILKSIEDEHLFVFKQEHSGVSKARNLALSKITGKYVVFLDADDNIDVDKLNIVLDKIENENPDLSIYGICDRFVYCEDKIELRYNYVENKSYDKFEFFQSFGNLLNKHIMYSPCNKIYKRSVIIEHEITFDIECAIGEDMLFNLDYLNYVNNVRMFDEFVYLYNHDMLKVSSSSRQYHDNEFSILLKIVEKITMLLKSKGTYIENEKNVHEFLVRKISYSINNLFFKGANLNNKDRLNFISNLYKNSYVVEALNDSNVSMQETEQKLLHFLHRRRWKRIVLFLYKLRNRK